MNEQRTVRGWRIALHILMMVFGVILVLHGLCSALIWFMLMTEHGQYPWLIVAMFLGSFPEAGVGVLLLWWFRADRL
jgi:hypothetical protein